MSKIPGNSGRDSSTTVKLILKKLLNLACSGAALSIFVYRQGHRDTDTQKKGKKTRDTETQRYGHGHERDMDMNWTWTWT